MKTTTPLYNQRGTTLINVLMAAGIGAIILAGITSMITDVFKSQRSIQSKDSQRELNSSIRKILSDPVICAASFGGGDPAGTGFTKTQILDTAIPPNIKFQTGVNYLNNLVTLTGFEVRNFSADNVAVNPKIGKSELVIKTNKIGSTIGAVQMTTTVFLQTTLDAANKINSCYSLGFADSLWQMSPTNMADIYYPSGNVGIGTTAPAQMLDVYGGAAIRGMAFIGDGTSSDIRKITAATSLNFRNHDGNIEAVIDSSGKVGIGTTTPQAKLEVAGGIRSGSATLNQACSPLGAQAYDPATGAPLYCSNTGAWTSASSSVPAPPVCTDPTMALHWTGSAWSCDSMTTVGGTPCGSGNQGVTMYSNSSSARFCCKLYAGGAGGGFNNTGIGPYSFVGCTPY